MLARSPRATSSTGTRAASPSAAGSRESALVSLRRGLCGGVQEPGLLPAEKGLRLRLAPGTVCFEWRPRPLPRSPCHREIVCGRFKEIAHPAKTVWMHHLELRDVSEVDDQVCGWLADAYESAG